MELDMLDSWDAARLAKEREQKTLQFYKSIEIGKKAEAEVSRKLRLIGYTVIDISNNVVDGAWSPFDLLITNSYQSFVADVKWRSIASQIWWFKNSDVEHWDSYSTTSDKLIMFLSGGKIKYIELWELKLYMFHKKNNTIWNVHSKNCRPLLTLPYYEHLWEGYITLYI
jgi:hypothetical protein